MGIFLNKSADPPKPEPIPEELYETFTQYGSKESNDWHKKRTLLRSSSHWTDLNSMNEIIPKLSEAAEEKWRYSGRILSDCYKLSKLEEHKPLRDLCKVWYESKYACILITMSRFDPDDWDPPRTAYTTSYFITHTLPFDSASSHKCYDDMRLVFLHNPNIHPILNYFS